MNDEIKISISLLRELLYKYPDKTFEILCYVFGKENIMKIIKKEV